MGLVGSRAQSQNNTSIFGENSTEYKRQWVGGIQLHTQGLGINAAYGKRVNGFKQRMLQLEIVNLKHRKEVKSFSPYEESKGYVFGKLNQVYLLRPTIGFKHQKYDKRRKSGVEVGYVYGAGLSMAAIKPVFLEIGYPEFPFRYLQVERYDPDKHNTGNIYGRSNNLRGVEKMSMVIGLHAKGGFVFEYSPEKDGIKALEVGAAIDIFPRQIPIMAFNTNSSTYLNFYLQLLFGKKYIK